MLWNRVAIAMSAWSTHVATNGQTYYYNRTTGLSTWDRPPDFVAASRPLYPTLSSCLNESPKVAALFNGILQHCGPGALPRVSRRYGTVDDPLCAGGRGGAYCCKSQTIYLCAHPWVSCTELAYELSHALNTCRGFVHCHGDGLLLDGKDCGYLSPPDVACSELRASYFTGRCTGSADQLRKCMDWHARWAVSACFPDDDYLEAHVRWARSRCWPDGEDRKLGRPPESGGRADAFVEQPFRG